jgi:hypothetical protein
MILSKASLHCHKELYPLKALHDMNIWKWIIKLALGGLVSMVSISSAMPMCQFQKYTTKVAVCMNKRQKIEDFLV